MYLASLNPETLRLYNSWFEARNMEPPMPGDHMVLVRDDDDLLAGVWAYVTRGPYMFFEHFTVNPMVTGRQKVRVLDFVARSAAAFGAFEGKIPLALVNNETIQRVLESRGFVPLDHTVMLVPIGRPPARVPEEVDQALSEPEPEPEPSPPMDDDEGGVMAAARKSVRAKPRRKR